MAYSKNELGTINTLYFPKKKFHITPLPPHNGHLCTTATFFVLYPGKETSYTDLTLFFFSLVVGDLGTRLPARWPLLKGLTVHVETKVLSSERC